MSEHLVDPDDVRAYDAAERPRFEDGMATEHRKTYRESNEKASPRSTSAPSCSASSRPTAASRRDLGLMDFSDQIALAARLAETRPRSARSSASKFKVVLLDEYQDTSVAQALMLSRLFSGPDAEHGRGHPVTAVGDPNQAIYGWRGASVSNILEFAQRLPGAPTARSRDVPAHRQPALRRAHPRDRQPPRRRRSTPRRPELLPLEAKPGAARRRGRGAVVHETYDDELAWLADRVRRDPRARWPTPALARDRRADPRQRPRRRRLRRAERAGRSRSRSSASRACCGCPRSSEVVATLDPAPGRHRQRRAAHPARRAALGDRAARPRAARPPGPRARRQPAGRRAVRRRRRPSCAAAVEGADPTEIASLVRRARRPGRPATTPTEARERFGLLADELRRLRAAIGEPLLDLVRRIIDITGIDVELASSVSPAAAARRDNLDLFVQAVAEFQAVDGQVTLAALLAWLEAEDEFGQGLDVATPSEADSVKLLTVHRAKGLEWDAVFLVGVTERKFPTNQAPVAAGSRCRSCCPRALRGDARDLPQLAGHTPDDIAALRQGRQGARGASRSSGSATSRGPAPGTGSSCPRWCWAGHLKTGLGPSAYLLAHPGGDGGLGRRARRVARHAGRRARSTRYAAASPDQPWPISHRTAEVDAPDRGRRAGPRGRPPTTPDDAVEDMLHARRRSQQWDDEIERLLEEAPARPSPRDRGAAAVQPVRDRRWPGCATTRRRSPATWPGRCRASRRPRPGSAPASTPGSRRASASSCCSTPTTCPAAATPASTTRPTCASWSRRSRTAPFADRVPHAVEPPFALVLGRPGGPRPDRRGLRRGPTAAATWSSTGRPTAAQTADPLQLAIYRLAWAELHRRAASSGSARRSTTSAPASWSSTTGCPTGPTWSACWDPEGAQAPSEAASAISTIAPNVSWRSCAVVSSPVTMWSETVQIASALRPYFAASV